ncbi:hypothetical protein EVAR_73035_1 [Eumeta japonica]|uniref:Uncharacterized protein n=1 Tax=Eumeta variegata TaxID=151549 RepID=A0A4C1TKX2_EUMVA|nr:hypothetical protein EVAR_73035_1 [Eumeta japonica]
MHLIKAHNLNTRDMEKINVQAKPHKIEDLDEPIGEIQLEIKDEPIAQDTDSQSQTTSETDSSTVEKTTALKTHREIRADTCGKVKFNPRAIGPRVRVIRGNVIFEPQPEINPYLKSEDPKCVLSELQNQSEDSKGIFSDLKLQSEDSKSVIFEIQKTI